MAWREATEAVARVKAEKEAAELKLAEESALARCLSTTIYGIRLAVLNRLHACILKALDSSWRYREIQTMHLEGIGFIMV